jgi:SH3-like domain-containing protein
MIPLLFSDALARGMVAQRQERHKNPSARENAVAGQSGNMVKRTGGIALAIVVMLAGSLVQAADRGPVTNLPLPRYVSLKAPDSNVRRGPSLSHRIDWVFQRRNMPLRITAEHGHWRRVEDREGFGGWVHYSLISGNRTVMVERDMLTLHARPDATTQVVAALEIGVIAELEKCDPDWCRLRSGGYRGWARKSALWGVDPDEIRD